MYSLYRAWLMRDAVTAAGLATPPDVIILVGNGNEQFLAHRQLLSMHSGYLKSLLYDSTSASICVPNVMPDAFGPLLTYMYTGYLHLDSCNIYGILLATHLLHMPRALELCREYLVMNSTPSPVLPPPLNIVKPIPSRKAMTLPQPLWTPPPLQPLLLRPTPHGPFQSVAQATPAPQPQTTEDEQNPAVTETTTATNTSSSTSSSPTFVNFKGNKKNKKVNDENKDSQLDVACCDGPVQFYRVLNESYAETNGSTSVQKTKDQPSTSGDDTINKLNNPHLHSGNLAQLRKALEKNVECDNENYTCGYCNHAFKSHFCYEKHVKRHINHVERAKASDAATSRRQVRLLDMNVQYYPCKTCGSKFPSYYFVHKHRKLCHSTEDDVQSQSESIDKDNETSNHSNSTQ